MKVCECDLGQMDSKKISTCTFVCVCKSLPDSSVHILRIGYDSGTAQYISNDTDI